LGSLDWWGWKKNTGLGAAELLEVIRKEVSGFSGGSFQDDFTLVLWR